MISKREGKSAAFAVALVGMMAATVECGKLVLSGIPNVEVVTLLCGLYGYVFGWWGVIAAAVFVAIEPLIWGVRIWVVLYILYWPFLAWIFSLLGRKKIGGRFRLTLAAVLLTVWFGVLSSLLESVVLFGLRQGFFAYFAARYVSGILFYGIQIVCNAVLFPLLFVPLAKMLTKVRASMPIR